MRSSITIRRRAVGAAVGSPPKEQQPRRRFGRHQIAELPPISVGRTERRTRRARAVGTAARGPARRLPDGIGGCAFGPRLQAAVVTLTARHRVSRRGICELARDLFGVTLSTVRPMRSASAPPTRSPARICSCRTGCWTRAWCMSMRPAGARVRRGPRVADRDHPRRGGLRDRRALQPRAVQRADRQLVSRDRDL